MKIRVMSDLHLDWHRDHGASFVNSVEPGEVLVLAGDSYNPNHSVYALENLERLSKKFKKSFYVFGNHDFYGGSMLPSYISSMTDEITGLGHHLLDNASYSYKGVRFFGCTLWFQDDPLNSPYKKQVNDFFQIDEFEPRVYEENALNRKQLRKEMELSDVIITHHLPSGKSVDPKYKGSELNRFFVDPILDEGIDPIHTSLVIHGHTHAHNDYVTRGCRVVSNPLGYAGSNETGYYENFEVEI